MSVCVCVCEPGPECSERRPLELGPAEKTNGLDSVSLFFLPSSNFHLFFPSLPLSLRRRWAFNQETELIKARGRLLKLCFSFAADLQDQTRPLNPSHRDTGGSGEEDEEVQSPETLAIFFGEKVTPRVFFFFFCVTGINPYSGAPENEMSTHLFNRSV